MFLPIGDDVDNRSLSIIGILLIFVCVFVFVAELKTASKPYTGKTEIQQFVKTWGLVPKDLTKGRYVGLVSHIFLHGDFWHIAGNLIVLWAFANSLENHLGAAKLLMFFLLWGIAGGLAHAAMQWGQSLPLIGASGAIAGMIGAYWMAFGGLTKIKTIFWFFRPHVVMIPTPVFVFIWVMMQFMGASESKSGPGGIAWFCHLGGFLAGACTIFPFRNRTAKAMSLDGQGRVRFEDRPTEADDADEPLPAVEECPFCHTALEPIDDPSASFVRCPSPKCQRLVFLDPQLSITL
ncbi:MAG TPA: rhomboid family intramembrane serine protease [Pirellulales bacterium]|jgi:membrane associated rhomboid family serine protease|nr:rhomboid family intramembrane serine protease [Pirellulales bacterium]